VGNELDLVGDARSTDGRTDELDGGQPIEADTGEVAAGIESSNWAVQKRWLSASPPPRWAKCW
jgi:hypothetical protein